jgi:hypothetical protein
MSGSLITCDHSAVHRAVLPTSTYTTASGARGPSGATLHIHRRLRQSMHRLRVARHMFDSTEASRPD